MPVFWMRVLMWSCAVDDVMCSRFPISLSCTPSSKLTMLGVVIGVAAVIVTVAIGAGARLSVQQQINSLGSNLIIILPGSVTQSGAPTSSGGRRR